MGTCEWVVTWSKREQEEKTTCLPTHAASALSAGAHCVPSLRDASLAQGDPVSSRVPWSCPIVSARLTAVQLSS